MSQIAIAIAVIGFAVIAGFLLMRRTPSASPGGPDRVPPALRPGDTDDVLESDRLNKMSMAGLATVLFFAAFFPVYWILEPRRMVSVEEQFKEQSIERGREYYGMRTDPVTGEESENAIECARCHGVNAEGGENEYLDSATGQRVKVVVPELRAVFARYEKPPPGWEDARTYITATIERGRTNGILGVGDDMPTWSNQFGGPLTEQQVDDIVNYLESIQGEGPAAAPSATGEQIFAQFCASCHGAAGAGGFGPAFKGGTEVVQFPNLDDHIRFIEEGSKPGVPYGVNGRGTGNMPGWKGKLTDDQIRLVVEYERSL